MPQNARSQNAGSQNARSPQNASESRSAHSAATTPHSPHPKTTTSGLPANADRTSMNLSEFNPFTTSLESNATRLMDEVFADLERMLERGVQLDFEEAEPQKPTRSQSKSLASSPTPNLQTGIEKVEPASLESTDGVDSPSSLAVLPKLSPRQLALGDLDNLGEEADLLVQAAQTAPQPERQSFDMLLMSLMLASITLAAGSWFFFRDRLPQPVAMSSPAAQKVVSQQDAEFLDYVKRSVQRIDRAAQAQASAKDSTTNPTPTVLERVYIPIYQPSGAASNSPTSASPSPGAIPRVTVPASPAMPSMPPALVNPAPAPQTATATPSPAPAPPVTLIGLLELGDRSAALFEINGATQRIQLGERIGDSGWTLVSISNQEAVMRRNGEVRSIYVGQQF